MIKRGMLVLFVVVVLSMAAPALAFNSLCREDLDCDPFSPPTNDWTCPGQCEADKCEEAADVDFTYGYQYDQCWSQRSSCLKLNPEWICQVELENCIAQVEAAQAPECNAVRNRYYSCLSAC